VRPDVVGEDPPLVVCCDYGGCVPGAVVGYKDRGVAGLAPLLGHVLAAGVLEALHLPGADRAGFIVPAPSSPASVRRRGFDHMQRLARRASASTGVPSGPLLRSGRRADLAGMGFAARRRSVAGTMRARPGESTVILVDDVRTSGATLAECRRALHAAGHRVAAEVVIASGLVR
jgi:predicted amidophosphoribosyltransferase